MKILFDMDYEKKYKEALERAKEYLKEYYFEEAVKEIFPELKEDGDEYYNREIMAEKEHAIGERFEVDGIIYEVRPSPTFSCQGCSLHVKEENECLDRIGRFGHCGSSYRKDGQDVNFVQVGEKED